MRREDLLDLSRMLCARPSNWNETLPRIPDGTQALKCWYDCSQPSVASQDAAASFTAACKHYLSRADTAALSATTTLMGGVWVKFTTVGADRVLVCKGASYATAATLEYSLAYIHSVTNFRFAVSNGSTVTSVTDTGTAPVVDTWYFVRFGLRSGTLYISRNAGAEITSAACPNIQDAAGAFSLGGCGDLATYHNGALDSVYITKTDDTAYRAALYNSGLARRWEDCSAANGLDVFATNCLAWHNLSEATGSATWYDSAGDNDLTFTADPIISPTLLNGGFETLGAGETLGSELLSNPGFETAGAGGADVFGTWTESAGSGAIADTTTAGEFKSGSHAAKFTGGASNDTLAHGAFAVTASTRYKLTFWSRGDGTYAGQFCLYDVSNNGYITNYASTGVIGTAYALVTLYFTTPAGCTSARVYLKAPSSNGGIAYFDDVSVKQVTAYDIFANWTESVAGSSTITADTASPYAGTYCARFDVDAVGSLVEIELYPSLVIGKKYTTTCYAKASSAGVTISATDSSGALPITLTTSYALYTSTWTTARDSVRIKRQAAASKTIFVDNVTLVSAELVSVAGVAQGPCADTDAVARLNDSSGFGLTLTQADKSLRPTWRTNQQNGLPALVWTGSTQKLSNAADSFGTGDLTVYVAAKATGWGGGNVGKLWSNGKFILYVNSAGYLSATSDGVTVVNSGAASITLDTPFTAIVTRTSAGALSFYLNGVLSGSAGQASGAPAAGTPSYMGNIAAGTGGFTGLIHASGGYGCILTAPQIAALTTRLRTTWGI